MFGFLNVYKPSGITSHDVVARLRKITGIKQIGHTGTLDPFAEGVLPVCIGKATRLIEYLADDKAYEGVIQLGKATTTYDREGEVSKTSDKLITEAELLSALEGFRGDIEQKPPIFSAIKLKGKKLYEYARAGEEVDVPARKVTIYKLELKDFDYNRQQARVYIECSKGTYIRSIANDLGEALGCFAFLDKLIRVKAGKFTIDKAYPLDSFTKETTEQALINPLNVLDYKQIEINESELAMVKNGMRLKNQGMNEAETVVLTYKGNLASIAEIRSGEFIQKKVFI